MMIKRVMSPWFGVRSHVEIPCMHTACKCGLHKNSEVVLDHLSLVRSVVLFGQVLAHQQRIMKRDI